MNLPRALRGRVYAMARPARPQCEAAAVSAAAAAVRAETGITATEPVAREIARRVVAEVIADLDRDDLSAKLLDVAQRAAPDPFLTLALDAEIDTAADFEAMWMAGLRPTVGHLPRQEDLRARVATLLTDRLANRYGHHLRMC